MEYDLRQLTNNQLFRLNDRSGYRPFGYDRATLRITEPDWLEAFEAFEATLIEFVRRGT